MWANMLPAYSRTKDAPFFIKCRKILSEDWFKYNVLSAVLHELEKLTYFMRLRIAQPFAHSFTTCFENVLEEKRLKVLITTIAVYT